MKKIQPAAQMRSEFEDQEHSWVYGISNVSQYGPNAFQKQTNWETVITNKPLVKTSIETSMDENQPIILLKTMFNFWKNSLLLPSFNNLIASNYQCKKCTPMFLPVILWKNPAINSNLSIEIENCLIGGFGVKWLWLSGLINTSFLALSVDKD